MSLVFPVGYDPGYLGALHYQYGAALTTPGTVTDPTTPSGGWYVAGPCSLPAFDQNDNWRPIQGAGSGRDLGAAPGRRENTVSTRFDVCSGEVLAGAFRKTSLHDGFADPSTRHGGYVNGLPLMHLLVSQAGSQYETSVATAEDVAAVAGLDSLVNSLRMEIAEGQNVTADMEWWPLVMGDASPALSAAPTYTSPIVWQSVDILVGGDSFKPYLAGVSFGINNSLERVGTRNMLMVGTNEEYAISRTAYEVVPKLEQLQVSYRLHRRAPVSWRKYLAMGQVVVSGTSLDGSKTMSLTIDNNYLTRQGGQQAQANAMQTFSADTLAFGVTYAYT